MIDFHPTIIFIYRLFFNAVAMKQCIDSRGNRITLNLESHKKWMLKKQF